MKKFLICLFTVVSMNIAWGANNVRVLVPVPAGNIPDVVARLVTEELNKDKDRTFYVDNQPTGVGRVAAQILHRSAPDGNTLLIGASSLETFEEIADCPLILKIAATPQVLVTNKKYKTLAEFFAEAHKDRMNYGTHGPLAKQYWDLVSFKERYGFEAVGVPYAAMTEILNGIISGYLDYTIAVKATFLGQMDQLSVFEQISYPLYVEVWAPPGTPAELVKEYRHTIYEAIHNPGFLSKVYDIGKGSIQIQN